MPTPCAHMVNATLNPSSLAAGTQTEIIGESNRGYRPSPTRDSGRTCKEDPAAELAGVPEDLRAIALKVDGVPGVQWRDAE
jgi:hypothetical protein